MSVLQSIRKSKEISQTIIDFLSHLACIDFHPIRMKVEHFLFSKGSAVKATITPKLSHDDKCTMMYDVTDFCIDNHPKKQSTLVKSEVHAVYDYL